MVFHSESKFQQFVHSKFRENTIRILHIPSIEPPPTTLLLVVNKYGKVGLYDPDRFNLLHTYMLDLSMPLPLPDKGKTDPGSEQLTKKKMKQLQEMQQTLPKCQRTHLVADAVHAPDLNSVIFATTKNILQWYDLGDIESLSFGLEVFPRRKFLKFRQGQSPVLLRNKGHVETHRIYLNHSRCAPIHCMEYFPCQMTKFTRTEHENIAISGRTLSKLIMGDQEGFIYILSVDERGKMPFGKKKTRGVLHRITSLELETNGTLKRYRAHQDVVREVRFIPQRQLIISCSRDQKFSLFIKDFMETTEPYIISLAKGINSFTHSEPLKLIATGSDDAVLRLFNQFVMKMPQMELTGHKEAIVAVEFLQVPFSDKPILISYSKDVELRAWDPVDFVCLQSLYLSFPTGSTIMSSKTPEFGKKPLIIYQPNYKKEEKATPEKPPESPLKPEESATTTSIGASPSRKLPGRTGLLPNQKKGQDGMIILLYCNSFCKLDIEKDTTHWPFDFEDFIAEFEDLSSVYEKKLRDKHRAYAESRYSSKDPSTLKLNPEEMAGIEMKLDSYVQEILKIKRHADKQLRSAIYDPQKLSLAGEGTRKFLDLKDKSKQAELFKKAGISTAFKNIPLYELSPVEFRSPGKGKSNKKLRVTQLMKEGGLQQVTSVSDLLTPVARKCFIVQRLKDLEFEANITARTAEEMSDTMSDGAKQEIRRDRLGQTMSAKLTAHLEEGLDDNSLGSDGSHKIFYRKGL